jgi:hypothetical protein
VCICILSIATVDAVVEGGREAKEEAENRLFNTRGVSFGKAAKLGSSTGRAITAGARAACAIGFDAVLPMGGRIMASLGGGQGGPNIWRA